MAEAEQQQSTPEQPKAVPKQKEVIGKKSFFNFKFKLQNFVITKRRGGIHVSSVNEHMATKYIFMQNSRILFHFNYW